MSTSVKETITLTQALTMPDREFDAIPQLQETKTLAPVKPKEKGVWMVGGGEAASLHDDGSSSSSGDAWDPDADESSDDELQGKWYKQIVKEFFVGSVENFKKARELYKVVGEEKQHNMAFFYKLKDKQREETKLVNAFDGIEEKCVKFLIEKFNTTKDIKQTIADFQALLKISSEQSTVNTQIIKALSVNISLYKQLSSLPQEQWDTENIGKIFKELKIRELFLDDLYIQFFGVTITREQMKRTGVLYCPDVQHCWTTNLAWVFGHIQKGSVFLVCSDILRNKFRRTTGREDEHTAFLREICTALKAGYTLISERGKITLHPTAGLSLEYLRQLDTTMAPGNGINPSPQEIEQIYAVLKQGIESDRNFTYRYDSEHKRHYLDKKLISVELLQQQELLPAAAAASALPPRAFGFLFVQHRASARTIVVAEETQTRPAPPATPSSLGSQPPSVPDSPKRPASP